MCLLLILGGIMIKVDLNCDLGESFGAYRIGNDESVIPLISSANVACGFHAGDAIVMNKTVELCRSNGVSVGAHPGFPDLMGFGRRNMAASPDEVYAYTVYQIGALRAFLASFGLPLAHVKPHGAMYNMAAKSPELSDAICRAIVKSTPNGEAVPRFLCLAGSEMCRAAERAGLEYTSEVFADRAYEDDGTLVARSKPGAVITDENIAIERCVRMVREGKVTSVNGNDISIKADSICVHGDNIHALEFVRKIRQAFVENGISVEAPAGRGE